ncbi:MFS transporter [Nocardiopsis sp. CT-R113]|uniref:MFS transporter n=1 Tax=Nocardiopsis codii TaxID=3065942 RepID=A0ABU7K4G8_9ACTN|nr:MFS transporter [Nocardiopsis sp. CT-R113]MEE2037140.1 MFS transporter [Nocardiopsis sp. CT-R113]
MGRGALPERVGRVWRAGGDRRLWSRDFSLFFSARVVAKLGDGMLPVALSAGLIAHGHGAGGIGLAMASFSACFVGFVIFGGVLSDRWGARRLMVLADLVRVLTQGTVAVLFLTGHVVLWQICAIGAVNGIAAGAFQPGVASVVPRVSRDVHGANAVIRTAEALAMLLGPAVAGLLVGVFSAAGVLAAHAGTYAVGAVLLGLVRLPGTARRRGEGPGYVADLAEGWREFRSRTWMWSVILLWMVLMVSMWGPQVPLTAAEIIPGHGAAAFGLVSSTLGGGTALGGLVAMRVRPRFPLRAGTFALFGAGAFSMSVGAGLPVPALAAGAAVSGAVMGFWGVMWNTSVQTQTPGPVLGRIHSYEVAGSLAMMPVGQALAGPAAELFGARPILLTGGAATLLVGLALLLVRPVRDLPAVSPRP